MKKDNSTPASSTEIKRRLSIVRVVFAAFALAGLAYITLRGWENFQDKKTITSLEPWFAPYVDVTATPRYAFEQTNNKVNNLTLSFIVSSLSDACTPSWGGVYTLEEANSALDLDRRIARFKQQGGNVAMSFGGLLNDELALNCEDTKRLKEAYLSVIERYGIDTIDLDLEGEELTDAQSLKRRAEIVADIQGDLKADSRQLAVWLTLPVATFGLTEDGANSIHEMLINGVDLSGVNVMTMDYGESREKNLTMQEASEMALIETHRQLKILYERIGVYLSDLVLWTKIGATPMIGQNDVVDEIFTLEDASGLNEFAISKGVSRMSMWSANRDMPCGENYVNISVVSDSCSGVKQDKFAFSDVLIKGFGGSMSNRAALLVTEDPEDRNLPDDPSESPYQIWMDSGTYLAGTKVVWHRNVYQAKWWTRGDIPDNPVLQSWETPWQLVGPVLPGEKPVLQPTLPPGTYPNWSGSEIYDTGQRILFDNVPYEAKWWTQGDSPAASTSNPDSSPWLILTQKQIEAVIQETQGQSF